MRLALPLAALALPLFLCGAAALNDDDPPAGEDVLHECMEGMKTHLKGAAMALQDPEGTATALEHVAELERLVLLAKLQPPANLESIAEEGRAAHTESFRRDLIALLRELLVMEEHLLDGDHEAAFEVVAGPLYEQREAAHEKYQER